MKQTSFRATALAAPAAVVLALGTVLLGTSVVSAKGPAVQEEDGKYYDKNGDPTYNIQDDGTVDWYTYSGFRRYHSECHVCHGPDGLGSTYAPALADSLKTMDYAGFLNVVVNGRKIDRTDKESVMPSFADNKNVMCFIDDIYIYLKARADGAIPRGRPRKRADKPQDAREYEKSCFGNQ
jgi:methanol metabolism-related c-type cytochrome